LEVNVQVHEDIAEKPATRSSRRSQPKPIAVPVQEACQIGGFGVTTAYELIKQGKLKTVAIGRRRLVIYSSLEELFQQDTS
jgi:excisionase family DNA binding protein